MSTERIKHLRSMLLIHSYLYYRMDEPIVTDEQWQLWAEELKILQKDGNINIGWYDKAFADWDGTTGMHLPEDKWIVTKAINLWSYKNENKQRQI